MPTAEREGELAEGERPHPVHTGRDEAEPHWALPAGLQRGSSEPGTDTDTRQVLGLGLPTLLLNF